MGDEADGRSGAGDAGPGGASTDSASGGTGRSGGPGGAVRGRSIHPAVAGREGPLGELADTVRRLVALVVTNTAEPDVLDEVVRQLRAGADVLAAHVPDHPVPRFVDIAEPGPPADHTGPAADAPVASSAAPRSRPWRARWSCRCPTTRW